MAYPRTFKKLQTRRCGVTWTEDEDLQIVGFLGASNLMEYHVVELCGKLGRSAQAIDKRIRELHESGVLTEEELGNWPYHNNSADLVLRNGELSRKGIVGFNERESDSEGITRRITSLPIPGGVDSLPVVVHLTRGNAAFESVATPESDEELVVRLNQKVDELNVILSECSRRKVDVVFNRFDMVDEQPINIIRITKNLFKPQD